jgi:hypothetical protein
VTIAASATAIGWSVAASDFAVSDLKVPEWDSSR